MRAKFVVVALALGLGITAFVMSALGQSPTPLVPESGPPQQPLPMYGPSAYQTMPDLPGYGLNSKYAAEENQLTQQVHQLVGKLRDAKTEADKEKLKSQLAETLEKQFDLRQKRHASEIEHLEAQVKKLKELVQKRQEARRDIIGKRLDQLQREAEGLGW